MIATLGLAGLLSGLVLSLVYQVTKPIIDANNARELRAAVFEVVPGATALREVVLRGGQLVPTEPGENLQGERVIYLAYDQNEFLGYAIEGQGAGFQDTIRLLYGLDPRRNQVIGMAVLESLETPGLGDKIIKDADFRENFSDLSVEPEIVVTKDGRTAGDNKVDAITGATISTKAVVKIINAAQVRWRDDLPASLDQLPPPPPPASDEDETPDAGDEASASRSPGREGR